MGCLTRPAAVAAVWASLRQSLRSGKVGPMPPRLPLTPDRLLLLAQDYVSRFGGPSQNLHRVLQRHVDRRLQELREAGDHDAAEAEGLQWPVQIRQVVQQMVAAGAVDDDRFAEAAARVWAQKGIPEVMVQQRLAAKGIAAPARTQAITAVRADHPDGDAALQTAHAYARRRGLGPYRRGDLQADRREKDLQAMLRAGHAFAVAKQVIGGEPLSR